MNKKKFDRFADLMAGMDDENAAPEKTPAVSVPKPGNETLKMQSAASSPIPVLKPEMNSTEIEETSPVVKISVLKRLKAGCGVFFGGIGWIFRKISGGWQAWRETRKIKSAERQAGREAEKLAAEKALEEKCPLAAEKTVAFPADISVGVPSVMPEKTAEKKKAPEISPNEKNPPIFVSRTSPAKDSKDGDYAADLPYDDRDRSLWGVLLDKMFLTPRRRWITVGTAGTLLAGIIFGAIFMFSCENEQKPELVQLNPQGEQFPKENFHGKNAGGDISGTHSLKNIPEKTENNPITSPSSTLNESLSAFSGLPDDPVFSEMRTNDTKDDNPRAISPGSLSGRTHPSAPGGYAADIKSGTSDSFEMSEFPESEAISPGKPAVSGTVIGGTSPGTGHQKSAQENTSFGDIFPETISSVKPSVPEKVPGEIPGRKTEIAPDPRYTKVVSLESLPPASEWRKTEKSYTLGDTLAETPNFDSRDILAPADFVVAEETPRGRELKESSPSKIPSPTSQINVPPKTEKSSRQAYPVFTDSAPGFAKTENRPKSNSGMREEKTFPRADIYSKYENAESVGNAVNKGKISEDMAYAALKGENYSIISEKAYGTGSYARAIALYNNINASAADYPVAGAVIYLPEESFLRKCYPTLCPETDSREMLARNTRTEKMPAPASASPEGYVIREGDSLADIAKAHLGSAARWVELYRLNQDVLGTEVDHLTPGVRLQMPGTAPEIIATRREDGIGTY